MPDDWIKHSRSDGLTYLYLSISARSVNLCPSWCLLTVWLLALDSPHEQEGLCLAVLGSQDLELNKALIKSTTNRGTGEMVPLVKCLLCKNEYLRPQVKKPGKVAKLVITVLGRQRGTAPCGLTIQTA